MSDFNEAAQCNYQTPLFKAGDHVMLRLGDGEGSVVDEGDNIIPLDAAAE